MMYEKLLRKQMDQLKPMFTCEWGSGKSTDIILSYDCVKAHVIIEHNREAYEKLDRRRSRLFAYYIPDLDMYPIYPREVSKELDMEFKLMFINGEKRIECLKEAKDVLHFFGVAVMTDAQKIKYMKTMNECFPDQEWDTPDDQSYTVALKTYRWAANENK